MLKQGKMLTVVVVIMIFSILMTGCSIGTQPVDPGKADPVPTQGNTGYPLTLIDSYKNEVVIQTQPQRVISVAPSITETIFALGGQGLLVGRTDFCDYPADVGSIASIGGLTSPNIEQIVALQPDLVIASTHFKQDVYDKLKELGMTVLVLDPRNSFDGVYDMIEALGQTLNLQDQAQQLNKEMQETIAWVQETVRDQPRPRVYYVVGYGEYGDFTAGGGTFINDLIRMAGGDNVAQDVEGWKYSLERVVEQDPDLLICSQHGDVKEGIKKANGYRDLTAVREGRLYEIDNNLLDRQGPRVAEGLKQLAAILHPGMFE